MKKTEKQELGLHVIAKAFNKRIEMSNTKFYTGSLRSGQKLEFQGSVVVIGDANSGSEIVAGEHIIVLGILRGLAHAGASGNKKAVIAAKEIGCPQIRIANIVKELNIYEEEAEGDQKEYAFVENDEIILKQIKELA
ncbi:MAG: hypothetical protein FWF46_05190 [Oscillospiraceae bacterium]|nr:hypothetical protein [Oscillospiraceae bacterium]